MKTISGLQECAWRAQKSHADIEGSDAQNTVVPIPIYDIAVGRSHAIAVLDNAVEQHDARFGRDGMSSAWTGFAD